MPSPVGSPAYIRKQEKLQQRRKEQRAAARLAAHGGPVLPPDEAMRLEYQRDPIRWAKDVLGVDERTLRWSLFGGAYETHVWDGDRDPMARIFEEIAAGNWVGVESGSGTGKTFGAGILVLWFLDVFVGSKVVTVAPKEKQLQEHLWKEIGTFWPTFAKRRPQAELKQLKLRMDPPREAWSALGFAVGVGAAEESATKAQGFHEERMLIIVEETPGVKQAVLTAFEQTCVRPKQNLILALGNPDSQQDPLHGFCLEPGNVAIRISAYDHPNVVCKNDDLVKGAVTEGGIKKALARWGAGSPLFESRVRGISPAQAVDALIRLEWLQEAAKREVPVGPPAVGVDVANSENGDYAAIARGTGARLDRVEEFPCPDANRMARERVAPFIESGVSPKRIGVDGIGVGAGAVNELRRLGYRVLDIQSGAPNPPPLNRNDVEQYLNVRAQMWWTLAQDLQHGRVGGPGFADRELQKELLVVKAGTRNGKIWVQAKEDLRRWLRKSPNRADAVVYWNWARQAGGVSGYSGLGSMASW
jgi:phage terminase large subunit